MSQRNVDSVPAGWMDGVGQRLIRHAARRAPESLSRRLQEECAAHRHGNFGGTGSKHRRDDNSRSADTISFTTTPSGGEASAGRAGGRVSEYRRFLSPASEAPG